MLISIDFHRLQEFPLDVPYQGEGTVETLLAAGDYNQRNSRNLTSSHFPQTKTVPEKIRFVTVNFGGGIVYPDYVFAALERHQLRPATAVELLAFGVAYPKAYERGAVIALGQKYKDINGYECGASISWLNGYRFANTEPIFDSWFADFCNFAGIRE